MIAYAVAITESMLSNGMRMTLRKPVIGDAEKLIAYLNTVGGESDNLLFGKDEFHMTVAQEIEYIKYTVDDPDVHYVIGLIGDEIVGTAHLRALGRPRIAHNCEVSLSVKKAYWGIGIGSALLEELIRFARAHGTIRNIHLGVKASNRVAIKLYEKHGFEKVGVHWDYFCINGVYDDEVLMDLYL
jgi:RimJ/RimL family protein N-acetyltransferase